MPSLAESEKKVEQTQNNLTKKSSIRTRSPSPQGKQRVSKESKQIKRVFVEKKDESFGCRNQNKDRNMLSSILKGYVQFILHNRGMVKMIERLSKKQGIENGVSGFYQHMATTFPQKKSYIGIQYMQKVLSDQESRTMTHILGVTLQHYLKEAYVLNLYQGSKLKKKMRLSLLKKAREINSLLFPA